MSSKAVIVNEPKPTACTFCAETFPSKTRLFQHLCLRHGLEDPKYDNYRTQRVALLIGMRLVDSLMNVPEGLANN